MADKRISVGDVVRLANGIGLCEVVKILPAGTVEVRACESGRVFRVSGLSREQACGAVRIQSFAQVNAGGAR